MQLRHQTHLYTGADSPSSHRVQGTIAYQKVTRQEHWKGTRGTATLLETDIYAQFHSVMPLVVRYSKMELERSHTPQYKMIHIVPDRASASVDTFQI